MRAMFRLLHLRSTQKRAPNTKYALRADAAAFPSLFSLICPLHFGRLFLFLHHWLDAPRLISTSENIKEFIKILR